MNALLQSICCSLIALGFSFAAHAEPALVKVPTAAGSGKPRDVKLLHEDGRVKLVAITLRNGTVLPDHSAAVPVTIQVAEGKGTLRLGKQVSPVERGSVVVLEAGVNHEFAPAEKTDMILLVTYLKGGGAEGGGHGH